MRMTFPLTLLFTFGTLSASADYVTANILSRVIALRNGGAVGAGFSRGRLYD
jgi:hypothetical protein